MVGGAEVQAYLLARRFLSSGWKVRYLTGDVTVPEEDNGILLHPFSNSGSSKSNYSDICAALSQIDADVYYQRGRGVLTSFLGRYSQATGKPFIFAVSMDTDVEKWAKYKRVRWVGNPLRAFVSAIRALREDRTALAGMRAACVILAQTKWQKQRLQDNLTIKAQVIRKVYDNPEPQLQDHPPTVLWLANIKQVKQPELFLRLAEDLNECSCQFVMIGNLRDSSYKKPIEDMERRFENFSYPGGVEYEESTRLIGRASVLVNTSLSESTPQTFIQAWTQRIPVVTLHHDPDGMITSQELGFCSHTYDQLVTDVRKLVEDARLRADMGERAQRYAMQMFNAEENFSQLLALVNDVVLKK